MTELLAALRSLVYMAGFLFLWGWLALQVRSIGADWTLPQDSRAVGTVLMIVGCLLVLSCVGWFVVVGRGTPAPFDPPRSFVPGGPYQWVRNPMYLGALLVLVGFGLWHASVSMVLLALPALALAHLFVVLYEEPALRRRFGMPYVTYLSLVNRWIPKPPRRS
jgi:protein-S-isoprenylcysteine O-methyltransferase Ste14